MNLVAKYINAYLSTIKYLNEMVDEPASLYDLSFEQYLIMQGDGKYVNTARYYKFL